MRNAHSQRAVRRAAERRALRIAMLRMRSTSVMRAHAWRARDMHGARGAALSEEEEEEEAGGNRVLSLQPLPSART
jgi:hypothetical protein